jgi:hypothetical protein
MHMSRQVIDTAIIAAVIALAAAQLYAQGFGSRKPVRPEQPIPVMNAVLARNAPPGFTEGH